MDTPMDPAFSTGVMLLIAAGAVALLLALIIAFKVHAFISLVVVSILTALATQIPLADIPDALMFGFAGTLGEVALLVAVSSSPIGGRRRSRCWSRCWSRSPYSAPAGARWVTSSTC